MSVRRGFPDLTDCDRRSLMRLLVQVRARRANFVNLIDSTLGLTQKQRSDVKVIYQREYRKLEHMVLVQFPECADTWPFEEMPEGKATCKLRKRMRIIDVALASAIDKKTNDIVFFFLLSTERYIELLRKETTQP